MLDWETPKLTLVSCFVVSKYLVPIKIALAYQNDLRVEDERRLNAVSHRSHPMRTPRFRNELIQQSPALKLAKETKTGSHATYCIVLPSKYWIVPTNLNPESTLGCSNRRMLSEKHNI